MKGFNGIHEMDFFVSEHNALADLQGILEVCTDMGNDNEELREQRKEYELQEKEFEGSLSKRQQQMYNDLYDSISDQYHIATRQSFILGYKTATRLLLDGLK